MPEADRDDSSERSQLEALPLLAAPTAPPETPQVRAVRTRVAKPPAVEVGPHGGIPQDCSAWGMKRQASNGTWEAVSYGGEGPIERFEWPIAEFSADEVFRRWGPGSYRAQWFKATPTGGRHFITQGSPVAYKQPVAVAPAPAAASPASSPALDQLTPLLKVMDMIDGRADAKIAGMAQLAAAIGGQQSRGLSGEDLRAILRDEREAQAKATADAIAAAVAPLHAAIGELSEDDDDEGGAGGAVSAAAGVAAPLLRGKSGWVQALNFAAAHPTLVDKAAPVVLGALGALVELFKATAPAVPAPPVVRPRVISPVASSVAPSPPAPVANGAPASEAWASLPLADPEPTAAPAAS